MSLSGEYLRDFKQATEDLYRKANPGESNVKSLLDKFGQSEEF